MSEKPTESSLFERTVSRRSCSRRQARSAPARSSPARSPARRPQRRSGAPRRCRPAAPITWGQDVDPGCIAAVRRRSSPRTTRANELMYDSLLEWDPKLNIRNALDRELRRRQLEADRLDAAEGRQVLERPGARLRPTSKYSFDQQAESAAARAASRALGQFPAIAVDDGALEVQAPDGPEGAGRPRLRLPRLGPVLVDRAERHVPDARPGDERHRHGPVQARRERTSRTTAA